MLLLCNKYYRNRQTMTMDILVNNGWVSKTFKTSDKWRKEFLGLSWNGRYIRMEFQWTGTEFRNCVSVSGPWFWCCMIVIIIHNRPAFKGFLLSQTTYLYYCLKTLQLFTYKADEAHWKAKKRARYKVFNRYSQQQMNNILNKSK